MPSISMFALRGHFSSGKRVCGTWRAPSPTREGWVEVGSDGLSE